MKIILIPTKSSDYIIKDWSLNHVLGSINRDPCGLSIRSKKRKAYYQRLDEGIQDFFGADTEFMIKSNSTKDIMCHIIFQYLEPYVPIDSIWVGQSTKAAELMFRQAITNAEAENIKLINWVYNLHHSEWGEMRNDISKGPDLIQLGIRSWSKDKGVSDLAFDRCINFHKAININ
jgi:hypothetical protein